MPISGVVIRCRPEEVQEVSERVSITGVEIHGVLPDGKIVAVIEAASVDGEVSIVSELLTVEGVLDVRLAYHDFSDLDPESESFSAH